MFEKSSSEIRFWRPQIPPALMKELLSKNDLIAYRDLAIRVGLQVGLMGALLTLDGIQDWFLWIPLLLVHCFTWSFLGWAGYGHELAHASVFSRRQVNRFLFALFSILSWSNYAYYRASHIRHHKYTLFRNLDGEGKNDLRFSGGWNILASCTIDIPYMIRTISIIVQNSCGIIKGEWGTFLYPPNSAERKQVVHGARVVLAVNLLIHVALLSAGFGTLSLIVFLGPFGCTLPNKLLASMQHFGGALDTPDFRQNTNTVVLPFWLSFLYANMNFHLEHHLAPGIPYYNLPKLSTYLESSERIEMVRPFPLIPKILS